MVVDTTLQFAARHNVPVRYNRNHVAATLKAMQRVSEIRAKRERVFYKNRMAGNKEREKEANRKLVAENEHLLPKIRSSERIAQEAREVKMKEAEEVRTKETLELERPRLKQAHKQKLKRRLLVDGRIENEMNVD